METLNILLNFCFFYRQFLVSLVTIIPFEELYYRLIYGCRLKSQLFFRLHAAVVFHHGELLYVVGRQLGRNMNDS